MKITIDFNGNLGAILLINCLVNVAETLTDILKHFSSNECCYICEVCVVKNYLNLHDVKLWSNQSCREIHD